VVRRTTDITVQTRPTSHIGSRDRLNGSHGAGRLSTACLATPTSSLAAFAYLCRPSASRCGIVLSGIDRDRLGWLPSINVCVRAGTAGSLARCFAQSSALELCCDRSPSAPLSRAWLNQTMYSMEFHRSGGTPDSLDD
jgi:hypothetical protein